MANKQPITILIAALGGEGGGVLAEWLVETALQAGYPAQSTSIPGVAQRTGATTYYVEIYPEPIAALGGRRPVLSLLPVPGCVDLVVASELLEAVRTVQSGMVSAERTVLVTVDRPHADDGGENGAGRRTLRFAALARRGARQQPRAGRARHGGAGACRRGRGQRSDVRRDRRDRRHAVPARRVTKR